MKAISQSAHDRINARFWPGTRQICVECDRPTGRCEQDEILNADGDPICEECVPHHDGRR